MLHGITSQKNEYDDLFRLLAETLTSHGISTLRIDFRGHGESRVPSTQFTVVSQILDARAGLQWMLDKTHLETSHLLGCSFGAPPALYLGAMKPKTVSGMTLLWPVLDYQRTFLRPCTQWPGSVFTPENIAGAYRDGVLNLAPDFAIDFKLLIEMTILRPYQLLRQDHPPALIVHGQEDSIVPFQITAECTANTQDVTLLAIPGMGHGFAATGDESRSGPESRQNLSRIMQAIRAHIHRR
jgi:pimeloyl-ACP methyl ester carboxylesterase